METLFTASLTAIVVTLIALMSAGETNGAGMSFCIQSNGSKTSREDGLFTCPSSYPLIAELKISRSPGSLSYYNLEGAKCCNAAIDFHANGSYDNRVESSRCPHEYFISGLYKKDGDIANTSCTRSTRNQMVHCENKTITFLSGIKNLTCPEGHYLSRIEDFRCDGTCFITIECCNLTAVNEMVKPTTHFVTGSKDIQPTSTKVKQPPTHFVTGSKDIQPTSTQVVSRVYGSQSKENDTDNDLSILSQMTITPKNAGPIGRKLLSITRESNTFNVTMAVDILTNLVSKGNIFNKTGIDFLGIVSNLQLVEKSILLKSQRSKRTSNRITSLIDEYTDKVPLPENGTLTKVKNNLAVFVQRINATKFMGITATMKQQPKNKNENFTENQFHISEKPDANVTFLTSITLPGSILNNTTKFTPTRISVVIYRNPAFFTPINETKANTLEVITAARFNGNHSYKNLTEPVVIKFAHEKLNLGIRKPVCVFWETEANNGFGNWSTEGCFLLETEDGVSICHCNHLTNFALLLNPYNNLPERDQVALDIISYVGCGLSLAGVTLTAISFLLFRDERKKSGIKLLISLCVALALLLITFLLGAERTSRTSDLTCKTAAIFLHYFTLVVFTSMAVIGYDLYVKLVRRQMVQQDRTTRSCLPLKYWFVSWGIPIVVVAITVAVSRNSYGNGDNYSGEDDIIKSKISLEQDEKLTNCSLVGLPAVVSLAVPVAIIILANAVAFVKIVLSLRESTNISSSRKINPKQELLRGIAILVILGITWVFGFLTLGDAKLTFQYLFTIFNSLQGFLIFVLYCLVPKKMRNRYKELFKRMKGNKRLSIAKDSRETLSMNTL